MCFIVLDTALFRVNLIEVINMILRYGHLKFFLWTRKAPLRMASRGSDLNIKIGKITQEIPQKA